MQNAVVSSAGKLLVLTRGGLPPAGGTEALSALKAGGKVWEEYQRTHAPRVGYSALNRDGGKETIWIIPPVEVVPAPLPKAPKASLSQYGDFPTCTNRKECPACGVFIARLRSEIQKETSDCGLVSLHRCVCGQLIRP